MNTSKQSSSHEVVARTAGLIEERNMGLKTSTKCMMSNTCESEASKEGLDCVRVTARNSYPKLACVGKVDAFSKSGNTLKPYRALFLAHVAEHRPSDLS